MSKILNVFPKPTVPGLRSGLYKVRNLLLGKESDKGLLFRILIYFVLIDAAYIYVNPIIYMMTTMIKNATDMIDPSVIWVPRSFDKEHLKTAWTMMNYPKSFSISMTVSLLAAFFQVVFCAIAGYAFARLSFPFKKFWFFCLIFSFVVPPQLTILPLIILYKNVGWINTYYPMFIPAIFGHGLKGALYVIIYRQFFSVQPKELEEAAKIDGASVFKIFYKVMLPLARPAIIVVFLFSFVWNWNDSYYPSMFMFGAKNVPLSIALARMVVPADSDITMFTEAIQMAGSFLTILPPLVLYAFTQRYFVEGVERTGLVE